MRRDPSFLFELNHERGETREKHWRDLLAAEARDEPIGQQRPYYNLIDTFENDFITSADCRIVLLIRSALIDNRLGLYESARASLLDALVITQRSAAPGRQDVYAAIIYSYVGSTYSSVGRHGEAIAAHTRAVALAAKRGTDEFDRPLDVIFVNYARSLLASGHHAEFDRYIEIADRRTRLSPAAPSLRAVVLSLKAQGLDARGRAGEAAVLHQQALQIGGSTEVVVNYARHLIGAGDYQTAATILRSELAARSSGNANPLVVYLYSLVLERQIDASSGAVQAEFATGRLFGHVDDARSRWFWPGPEFGSSREGYLYAIESSQREFFAKQLRTQFISNQLRLAWDASRTDPLNAERFSENAFYTIQRQDYSEAAQAVTRSAAFAAAGTGEAAGIGRDFLDMTSRIAALTTAIDEALSRDTPGLAGLVKARADAARGVASLTRDLVSQLLEDRPDDSDRFFKAFSTEALGLGDVQARLAPDDALLVITPVGEDIYVFAASKTKLSWIRAPGASGVTDQRVRTLRCDLDPVNCGDTSQANLRAAASGYTGPISQALRRFDHGAAHGLYQDLIAPVEGALTDARRVYVVAGGALSSLPLGVLLTAPLRAGEDDANADVLAQASWLSNRDALATLPSVASLKVLEVAGTSGGGPLSFAGYGDPRLGGAPPDHTARRGGKTEVFQGIHHGLASLPGTKAELEAIASALGAPADTVRLGERATETALRSATDLADAAVVVLATHGLIPREITGLEEPALIFTPPRRASASDDGVLTATEASQLKLSADWLILSACNTAAADGTPGGASLSGLARAFLYAGAKALLVSHWRVQDDVAAALTVETVTLKRRNQSLSKAQALQQAMSNIRSGMRPDGSAVPGWNRTWAHPAAWAPFVVVSTND